MAAAAASSSSSSSAAAVAATAAADDSTGSVNLHPTVIMNITDHLVRVQQQVDPSTQRVFGLLYGKQKGMSLEIATSFEMLYAAKEDGAGITVDKAYLENNIKLMKEVFQDYDVVGWYATGEGPTAEDMHTHRLMLEYSDNPVVMTLASTIAEGEKDLPISMFQSIFALAADGTRALVFSAVPYKIEASEAETVTLDAVANTRPDVHDDSVLVHPYGKTAEALRRLSERVDVLQRYLRAVQKGSLKPDRRLLRLVSDVVARVPTTDSEAFRSALLTDYGDTLLTALVASLTRGTTALEGALDKLEKSSEHSKAMGRGKGGGPGGEFFDDFSPAAMRF